MINDSVAALRPYDSLTNRTVKATQIELMMQGNDGVKLISLNGKLIEPGANKTYAWLESVYRGLTPAGVSTFYKHSCSAEVRRACVGRRGNSARRCIVDRFEKALSSSYSQFELDVMYPSYLPQYWNVSGWEASHGITIWPLEQWIRSRNFFWYLYEVHDFPFRKLTWTKFGSPPPESQCLGLLDGKPQFDEMPFPSVETFRAYQAEMMESELTQ